MTKKSHLAPLAVTLLCGAATIAAAQVVSREGGYDYGQLPTFRGTVSQYDLTPRGDIDGLLLADGTEVHFPPHLGTQVAAAIRPGDKVTIQGLKARMLPLVQAMAIKADHGGAIITDNGPPGGPGPGPGPGMRGPGGPPPPGGPEAMGPQSTITGVVKQQLHGPRADLNGVLLQDGTELHLPPPEADRLSDQLKPGQTITARGDLLVNGLGRVMAARAIGPTADHLTTIATPMPPPPDGPGDVPDGGPGGSPPPAQ